MKDSSRHILAGEAVISIINNGMKPDVRVSVIEMVDERPVSRPNTNHFSDIMINGHAIKAGVMTSSMKDGQKVTVMAINPTAIHHQLANASDGVLISIPIIDESDVVIVSLNGQIAKSLVQKEAIIEVITNGATYTLPANQINLDALSEQLNSHNDLQDVSFQIEMARPMAESCRH